MKNRLQFRHHGVGSGYTVVDGVFETREDAIYYIETSVKEAEDGLASIDASYALSLFGEPTVLRYKNEAKEDSPHLILAIGSVNSNRPTKNRFCIIDIDHTEAEIENLEAEIERVANLLKIVTNNSKTISLNSEETENGVVISGDVKVPETQIVNRVEKDNAIMVTNDGLFTYVNLEYNDNNGAFTFTVNNNSKTFEVDGNQVVGGEYDPEDESLHIHTKFGDDIAISLENLIDEWVVEGDSAKSPIILNRTEVGFGNESEHNHVEPWQDILSADVRIADDRVNNILKKTNDNRYLYVDGVATNIAYYGNSGKTTVQAALDELGGARPSTDSNNIVTTKADGLFASSKLEYISSENTLVFTTSTNNEDERRRETRIKLNSFSVFENIVYDPNKESLIITYIDGNGETRFLTIPIGELLTNWEIDVISEGHSVYLQKTRNIQGTDLISADVKLFNGSDNILQEMNHMLYVKGTSDNIKHGDNSTVKAEIDALKSKDSALDNKINLEIVRAQSKESDLDDKIDLEISRATSEETKISNTIGTAFTTDSHETVSYKFNELVDNVNAEIQRAQAEESTINDKIDAEIERSTNKDTEHDGKIEAIEDEIGEGFGPRNTVRDEIDAEKAAREANYQELEDKIYDISGTTSGRLESINNQDHSINVDATDAVNPVISVNLSSEIEDNKPNIIKINNDGLYAGVDLEYTFSEETGSNQLIFKTTNGTKTFDLRTNSVVDKIYYDPTREAIIVEYTVNGHRMPDVVIPIGDIINEWRVWDGHEGAVQLEKVRVASGSTEKDVLKASVVISDVHGDNILINDGGALYVSGKGITDNATAIDALDGRVNAAESEIDGLSDGLTAEIRRANDAEVQLGRDLQSEVERSNREDVRIDTKLDDEIARATAKDYALETAVNSEIARATQKDQELENAISSESVRALSAETALKAASDLLANSFDTLSTNVGNEIARLNEKDSEIEEKVNEIDDEYLIDFENTNTILISKDRALKGYMVKANVNIDSAEDNIIKETADGIYSKVDLTYDEANNKLTFTNTNGSKTISLISNSIVNKIYYNPADETIVIEYTVNGQRMEDVVVPVRDLINEIDVESTDTVELTKTINTSTGADVISANVKVNSYHNDNILVNDGGLYVSGAQIATNKDNIDTLNDGLAAEISRARGVENGLNERVSANETNISNESIRALSAETSLQTAINAEITRATNDVATAKTELHNEISNEVVRAIGEEARIEGKVNAEKTRAENAESALSDRIDAVDAKTFTLTVEDTTTIDLTYENNNLKGSVVLANGDNNIIKATSDSLDGSGLFASVDMEYNPATNKLKLITSAIEKEFSLSVGSILKSIEYDSAAKNLIIKYDVNIGGEIHEEQVFVPVEDLFNDWIVQEGQHLGAIVLHKEEGVDGNPDVLSAEIVISTLSDNMLINDQGSLYVSRRPIDDLSGQVITLREQLEASLATEDTLTLHLERDAASTLKGDVKISANENNLIKKDDINGGIIFDGSIDCGTY